MWEHFLEVCGSVGNNSYPKCDPYSTARYYGNMNFKQALFKMNEASRADSRREPFRNITNDPSFKKSKSSMYENCEQNRHLPRRNRLPVFIELAGREDSQ